MDLGGKQRHRSCLRGGGVLGWEQAGGKTAVWGGGVESNGEKLRENCRKIAGKMRKIAGNCGKDAQNCGKLPENCRKLRERCGKLREIAGKMRKIAGKLRETYDTVSNPPEPSRSNSSRQVAQIVLSVIRKVHRQHSYRRRP